MTKLLHVDDDSDILEVAKLALEVSGDCEVLSCSSGQEALEAAEAFAPDVLLLDVMMPDMSGPTTLEEMRKIHSLADVPVIFMTASVMADEVQKLWDLGAVEVIHKPFDPMTLREQVTAALGQ